MVKGSNKYIIYSTILLIIVLMLSVGFSAFQKQLLIDDAIFNVRIEKDTRVSNSSVSKTSGNAVSNYEDYNVSKIYGSVTFPSTSSYVLYKVDLTNYGNIKTGLLNITSNTSGVNYQICNSSGSSCTSNPKTAVCSGSNCTLGTTKEIYVKVTSTSTGTKQVDLDLDFEPYHNITYENFQEVTSSFEKEIMENDTYEVTLTSDAEEVSVDGAGFASYNKTNHKLTISNVTDDITVTAKYKLTDIAEETYTGTDPNNYVRYNDTLFRIITKETIDDGYGNSELRAKITKDESIGEYIFDETSNYFHNSQIRNTLNETYYGSLTNEAKEQVDTTLWYDEESLLSVYYVALINKNDFNNNSSWLNKNQFTINSGSCSGGGGTVNNTNIEKYIKISPETSNNKYSVNKMATCGRAYAIQNSALVELPSYTQMDTYPTLYLHKDVLMVGGTGTRTNPYLLSMKSDSVQSNPTTIKGRELTVTGSNQELITVTNKVGTPYYSTTTPLNSSNYTSGSTTIPSAKNVGNYTIYYYIPAGSNYKAKSGYVYSYINGITYTINYTKGENISEIGRTIGYCTTSGSSLTCTVTLPSITENEGYTGGKWNYNGNEYEPGSTFTLNSSNTGLTMVASANTRRYIATFHYNSHTSNGSFTDATTTAQCTVSSGSSCTVTVPTVVSNSVGTYNSAYKGVSRSTGNMTSGSLTLTGNQTFYTYYSSALTIYYPNTSNGISSSATALYRNEYYSSTTIMTTLTATSGTSTTQATSVTLSNLKGTFKGITPTVNNATYYELNNTSNVINKNTTTYYAVVTASENVTFKYNNNTTCGSATVSSTTGSVTSTYYCSSTSAMGTNHGTTTSVPSAVSSSKGQYNSNYRAIANVNSLTAVTTFTGGQTYYAVYSGSVTNYYYNSGYTNRTIYRNEYLGSTSATTYNAVLSTTNTGTSNYSTATGRNSAVWYGLADTQTTTRGYDSVANAATSSTCTTKLYTIYQYNVTYQKGSHVSSIGATSGNCLLAYSSSSCSVTLPSITPESGYVSAGWSTTNGATTGTAAGSSYTISNNTTTLYANGKRSMLMEGTSGNVTTNYLRTNIAKQDIESVTFTNSLGSHTANGTDCFDVSKNSDGGVLAWVTDSDSDGKYEITIGSNGVVYASSGYYLFAELRNLDSINGMNYLDISNVTSMQSMFQYTGYNSTTFTLDLGSNFDTTNVTNMRSLFHYTGYSSPDFTLDLGSNFDTLNVTDMSSMFSSTGRNSTVFTLDLGDKFDTSNVTSMQGMFTYTGSNSTVFTLDLGNKFDTSNVTSMNQMFYRTGYSSTAFTLDLGDKFDTTNVTNMSEMFYYAGRRSTVFTLDLGSKFDTSNVTTMASMFSYTGYNSTVFTLDLGSNFDTTNVTTMDYMFNYTGRSSTVFTLDLGDKFNTTKVTTMSSMFSNTGFSSPVFTLDLGLKFDTTNVTSMSNMFSNTGRSSTIFTLDLGDKFDTSNVTYMDSMFYLTGYSNTNFILDLGSKFNTTKVTNMSYMFYQSRYLKTIYVENDFDITNVTSSTNMFYGCNALVGGSGTAFSSSHIDASYAHIDGGTSNPGYFTKIGGMLAKGNSGTTTFFNSSPINKTDVEKITLQNTLTVPSGSLGSWDASYNLDNSVIAYYTDTDSNSKYEVIIASDGNIIAPQDSSYLFGNLRYLDSLNGMNYLDTTKVTNMSSMFSHTGYSGTVFTLDLGSNFDTTKVTNMSSMFSNTGYSSTVFTLDLGSNFDTTNVTNMSYMFNHTGYSSTVFTLDLGDKFDTTKVTDMSYLFDFTGYNSTVFTLNLGDKFDTTNVTNMYRIFNQAGRSSTVFTLDLGDKFDTSNVINMNAMFNCTGYSSTVFTLDLGDKFDTTNVTDMYFMFSQIGYSNPNFTLDLGNNFDTTNVTNMYKMFTGSRYLKTIYVGNDFDITNVTNSSSMFTGCNALVGGSGTAYNSSYTDASYAHIDGGTSNPGYFTYKSYPSNSTSSSTSNTTSSSSTMSVSDLSRRVFDTALDIRHMIDESVNKE